MINFMVQVRLAVSKKIQYLKRQGNILLNLMWSILNRGRNFARVTSVSSIANEIGLDSKIEGIAMKLPDCVSVLL